MRVSRRNMFSVSLFIAATVAVLVSAGEEKTELVKEVPESYVKIEVRGKLVRMDGIHYYVEASDTVFHDSKILVKLLRSEDKNRILDEHLKSLEGKIVVVSGYMDCRKIDAKKMIINLRLSNEEQVQIAKENKLPNKPDAPDKK